MSFATIRYLYCDGPICRDRSEPYSNAPNPDEPITAQRKQAIAEGWKCRDGVDLCPDCRLRVATYFGDEL